MELPPLPDLPGITHLKGFADVNEARAALAPILKEEGVLPELTVEVDNGLPYPTVEWRRATDDNGNLHARPGILERASLSQRGKRHGKRKPRSIFFCGVLPGLGPEQSEKKWLCAERARVCLLHLSLQDKVVAVATPEANVGARAGSTVAADVFFAVGPEAEDHRLAGMNRKVLEAP